MFMRFSEMIDELPCYLEDRFLEGTRLVSAVNHAEGKAGVRLYNSYFSFDYSCNDNVPRLHVTHETDVPFNNRPTLTRYNEMLNLGQAVQRTLRITSAQINRALNYLDRGSIEELGREPGHNLVGPEIVALHRIVEANQFRTAQLAQAVFDLSLRPLAYLHKRSLRT